MSGSSVAADLDRCGFRLLPGALDPRFIHRYRTELASLVDEEHAHRHVGHRLPALTDDLCDALAPAVAPMLGAKQGVLDATLFRKPPATNWKVPWHQDLLIAARTRVNLPGWSQWSLKKGVWHVQPPAAILERLLAVRIHLSDCGPDDGPLRLLAGIHRHGVLPPGGIADQTAKPDEYVCEAKAGDVLLMRPLVLHASRIAQGRSDRMVLHLVLGSAEDLRDTPLVDS